MGPDTVQDAASKVANFALNRTQVYQGPVMIVWGSDFRFADAHSMFGNMSYIVDYINAHPEVYKMHVRYATLSDVRQCVCLCLVAHSFCLQYFDYLYSLKLTFPVKTFVDFEYGFVETVHGLGLLCAASSSDGRTLFLRT